MKFKTTKKEVMNGYPIVIRVPYCALANLLNYATPAAYTSSRTYGWRADVYSFGRAAIVTGRAPFGTHSPSREIIDKYENLARHALNTSEHGEIKEVLCALLDEFIKEVIHNDN